MERVGDLLARTHSDLLVSKYRLRQAEGIEMVRRRRDEGRQNLGFNSRPFVFCGLPLRRPPQDQLLFERRNGSFVLQVTGHPEFGLPFGQDRLVPIFLATLAVRQRSQTIRFKSASVMLETFGMAKGGKEYRRLVAAFERILPVGPAVYDRIHQARHALGFAVAVDFHVCQVKQSKRASIFLPANSGGASKKRLWS